MRVLIRLGASILLLAALAWFGLPSLFKSFGLHPDYSGVVYSMPGGRALIITTSHGSLGTGGARTGVFASEMTAPYYVFSDGGMQVDVASIEGGGIPIDPISFVWFIEAASDRRFHKDAAFQEKVAKSLRIDQIDLASYDIVYLAGGWGAAYDLGFSDVLGQKISEAWKAGRVVGGICHGPLGLLKAIDENGVPLVQGRHLTAVTDKQVQELGITMTPQHPERELRAAGALFESQSAFRDIFANHIVEDGRLVTGQNQNAGTEVAFRMMKLARGKGNSQTGLVPP